MVALKKKYPDRVVLLLGNRDINKMRFTSELADEEIENLEGQEGPYWVPANKAVSPLLFLQTLAKITLGDEVCRAQADACRILFRTMSSCGSVTSSRRKCGRDLTRKRCAYCHLSNVCPSQ
jgi:hypothetical protein